MSYNKFTLEKVVNDFQLTVQTWKLPVKEIEPVKASEILTTYLDENHDWATAQLSEKTRSELIVSPVLAELRKIAKKQISIFSGKKFDVDVKKGLNGVCDYLISKSADLFILREPIIAVVEAKRGILEEGWGQCAAEMIASRIFNQNHKVEIPIMYGVVTSGLAWQFLKLENSVLYIQDSEIKIGELELLLGIFKKFLVQQ